MPYCTLTSCWKRPGPFAFLFVAFVVLLAPSLPPVGVETREADPVRAVPNVRVNNANAPDSDQAPSLELDPTGTLQAVWQTPTGTFPGIRFANSTDGGANWNDTGKRVSPLGFVNDRGASIVRALNGTLYVAWRAGPYRDVYLARSFDGGAVWSDAVRINTASSASTGADWPAILVNQSGRIVVAWTDWRNGNPDVYASTSVDGTTWTPDERLNDDGGTAEQRGDPALAERPDGTIFAAWEDYREGEARVYLAETSDGGATWSSNRKLAADLQTPWETDPSLAVDSNGTAYAVWTSARDGVLEVRFSRSSNGAVWTTPKRIDPPPLQGGWNPRVAVVGQTVYVAYRWLNVSAGYPQLALTWSLDRGTSWDGLGAPVNEVGQAEDEPALITDASGKAHLAWSDNRDGDWNIYFTSCTAREGMRYDGPPAEPVDALWWIAAAGIASVASLGAYAFLRRRRA